jgi:hypothetical protein
MMRFLYGLSCLRVQEVVVEVKKAVENKAGWTGQREVDGKEEGPICSADYGGWSCMLALRRSASTPSHNIGRLFCITLCSTVATCVLGRGLSVTLLSL